jgi:hypothetical protein
MKTIVMFDCKIMMTYDYHLPINDKVRIMVHGELYHVNDVLVIDDVLLIDVKQSVILSKGLKRLFDFAQTKI